MSHHQVHNVVDPDKFNSSVRLPFSLRRVDFKGAMQDVYDLFHDINGPLLDRSLRRLEEMLRPAAMSGLISDVLTASLANHSRSLTQNNYFNGHPDLIVEGVYPNDSVRSVSEGIEIKATRKKGGAVDTHGARKQWMCVFVYGIDSETEPARDRRPAAGASSACGSGWSAGAAPCATASCCAVRRPRRWSWARS